jgi:predicted porin
MKKLFLAAAVSALSVSAAQAAPVVYGKLNVGIAETDTFGSQPNGNVRYTETRNVANVNSYASRIGVKGEEKLTDSLNAIYQAEWEVNAVGGNGPVSTDTNGTNFNNKPVDWNMRNRFIGLKYDGIGAVKVGKMDTALKNIQGKVDIFKDMDMDHTKFQTGEVRANNVISLESDPRALSGVGAVVQLVQAENTKLTGNSENVKRNFGSAVSGALTYENKDYGLYAAAAADQNVASTFNGLHTAAKSVYSAAAEAQTFRVVGGLNVGALVNELEGAFVNVLVQTSQPVHLSDAAKSTKGDFYGFDRENSFIVSGGYTIPQTPVTVKGQFGQSVSKYNIGNDVKLQIWGGKVDYKLNSHATAYTFFSRMTDDRVVNAKGTEVHARNAGGVGLEYNF